MRKRLSVLVLFAVIGALVFLLFGSSARANDLEPSVFLDHIAYGDYTPGDFEVTITVPYAVLEDVLVLITNSNEDSFSVPTSVTILEGTNEVSFEGTVLDYGVGSLGISFYLFGAQTDSADLVAVSTDPHEGYHKCTCGKGALRYYLWCPDGTSCITCCAIT